MRREDFARGRGVLAWSFHFSDSRGANDSFLSMLSV